MVSNITNKSSLDLWNPG